MSEEHIIVRRDGAVLEIRFNRPTKKNAITNAMYAAMADALEAGAADAGVRAILFTAEGDLFTAGNDLMDFAAQNTGDFSGPRHVERFLARTIEAEKPVIAAVQGDAVGVGVTMLLHCDLVFVAEGARLTAQIVGQPETVELEPGRIARVRGRHQPASVVGPARQRIVLAPPGGQAARAGAVGMADINLDVQTAAGRDVPGDLIPGRRPFDRLNRVVQVGDLAGIAAIRGHGPDLGDAAGGGDEGDPRAVGRETGSAREPDAGDGFDGTRHVRIRRGLRHRRRSSGQNGGKNDRGQNAHIFSP